MKAVSIPNFANFNTDPELAYQTYVLAIEHFNTMAELLVKANLQLDRSIAQTDRAIDVAKDAVTKLEAEEQRRSRLLALLVKLESLAFGTAGDKLDAAQLEQLRIDIKREKKIKI